MATVERGSEVYTASLAEMAELSMRTAEEVAASQRRYEHIVATANGGLLLALYIGEALGIQVQTMRVDSFQPDGQEEAVPVIYPMHVRRSESESTIFATDLVDQSRLDLFRSVLPNAAIAANYSTLGKSSTESEIDYCGKVIIPQEEGDRLLIQFWYESMGRPASGWPVEANTHEGLSGAPTA